MRVTCKITVHFVYIFSIGLSAIDAAIKYSSAEYKCEHGIYEDLYELLRATRASLYAPSLHQLRKRESFVLGVDVSVSGTDVADVMQDYCLLSDTIVATAKGMMLHIPCLRQHLDMFESLIKQSHSYCVPSSAVASIAAATTTVSSLGHWASMNRDGPYMGVAPTGLMEGIGDTSSGVGMSHDAPRTRIVRSRVVPDILDILEDIPAEKLDRWSNKCYPLAAKKAHTCNRRVSGRNYRTTTSRRFKMKRLLFAMRCTFRQLARTCPKKTAFLLALIEYDWLIVPPPLGIDVARVIRKAWKVKLPKVR